MLPTPLADVSNVALKINFFIIKQSKGKSFINSCKSFPVSSSVNVEITGFYFANGCSTGVFMGFFIYSYFSFGFAITFATWRQLRHNRRD